MSLEVAFNASQRYWNFGILVHIVEPNMLNVAKCKGNATRGTDYNFHLFVA
jgi:hypothetical protein